MSFKLSGLTIGGYGSITCTVLRRRHRHKTQTRRYRHMQIQTQADTYTHTHRFDNFVEYRMQTQKTKQSIYPSRVICSILSNYSI